MTTTLTATYLPGNPASGLASSIQLQLVSDETITSISRNDINGFAGVLGSRFVPGEPIPRRNLIPNPSVELNTTGYTSPTAVALARDNTAGVAAKGSWALKSTVTGTTSSAYTGIYADASAATVDKWVGFGVSLRRGAGSTYYRQRIIFQRADNTNVQVVDGSVQLLPTSHTRRTLVAQVPYGTTKVWCLTYIYGNSGGSAPALNSTYHTDAWSAHLADTQAEASTACMDYMDGDTPATGNLSYRWAGTVHGSVSEELDAAPTTTLTLYDTAAAAGPVIYTARNVAFDTVATAEATNVVDAPWLVLPYRVQEGTTMDRVTNYSATRAAQSTVHDIIGSEFPTVVIGTMTAAQGVLELYAGSFGRLLELEALLAAKEVVMLRQQVPGMDMYFVPLNITRSAYNVTGQDSTVWRLTVEYAQVGTPAVAL